MVHRYLIIVCFKQNKQSVLEQAKLLGVNSGHSEKRMVKLEATNVIYCWDYLIKAAVFWLVTTIMGILVLVALCWYGHCINYSSLGTSGMDYVMNIHICWILLEVSYYNVLLNSPELTSIHKIQELSTWLQGLSWKHVVISKLIDWLHSHQYS